jgi:chitinase
MVAFLPGYAIGGKRNYKISEVPGGHLTHLNYCFAGFVQDGSVWKTTTPEPNDEMENFPALLALKAKYPRLRLMVSVGGAANSKLLAPGGKTMFSTIAESAKRTAAFVSSCVETFIRRTPPLFDGIDIDWEFPGQGESPNFAALAHEFRTQLKAESQRSGKPYTLSASVDIHTGTYGGPSLSTTQLFFDWLNLMCYNFNIPKERSSGLLTKFNAPLHASPSEPHPQGPNIDLGVQAYLDAGVPSSKLVLGVNAYAHSYAGVAGTNGGLYQPYTGLGPGTFGPGTLTYQDVFDNYLPISGRPGWFDPTQSTAIYLADDQIWISPQLERDVVAKAIYAVKRNLRGLMFWELSADKPGSNSLVGFMATTLRRTPP